MNVLVITYWDYHDPLIQTYTLPYLRLIHERINPDVRFHLFTLQKSTTDVENFDDFIEVHPRPYRAFGFRALVSSVANFVHLWRLVTVWHIELIHCWCTPAGVYGLALKWLTRRKLLIDSFEPHAEPMLEAGVWKKNSLAFRILFWFEKKQARHADYLIACVEKMKEYSVIKYGIERRDMKCKPACIDFKKFSFQKRKSTRLISELNLQNKVVCVYAGKLGGSYLKEEIFQFVKEASIHYGSPFRFLFLSNHPEEEVERLRLLFDINREVIIQRYVDHKDIPDYIGLGDFGLVPFVPVPSKRYGSPIKTGEYLAMGLPIIITKDISDDSEMIEMHNFGFVLSDLSKDQIKKAIQKVDRLNKEVDDISAQIVRLALKTRGFSLAIDGYDKCYRNAS